MLAARLDGADPRALRDSMDRLKTKLRVGRHRARRGMADGKVQLAAGVTADLTARLRAGDLVAAVAAQVGGKGGGRADLAMAGGSDPSALDAALASVAGWVDQRL